MWHQQEQQRLGHCHPSICQNMGMLVVHMRWPAQRKTRATHSTTKQNDDIFFFPVVFVALPPDIRTRSGTFNTTTASSFISVGRTIHALVIDYTLNSASKLIADVLVNPKKERERKKGRLCNNKCVARAQMSPLGAATPKEWELAPTSQRNRITPLIYRKNKIS